MKRVYMIAGKARHGKDTTACFIKEYLENKNIKTVILQISSPLKFYAKKILGWDGEEASKPRDFLQHIGISVIREKMGEDFLIKRLIDDIKVLFNYADCIVVSDVRLPLEFELVDKEFDDVVNVFIDRPLFNNSLTSEEKKHVTETALDNYNNYDIKIINDGSLSDLKNKVYEILKEDVL